MSLACSARPCLSVARHPSQGSPRGQSRVHCWEPLLRLVGTGRLCSGPLLPRPALVSAPLSGGGHPVLPSRALGFTWGRGRVGGGAAPMATLPWQVSLPGAYGQPSVGACLLTFQPDGACPAPSHQLLPGPLPPAPLALSICQSHVWSSLVDLGGMKVCVVCTCMRAKLLQWCPTPWTVACHALLSMGFSRQEYWNGLPCPPPGDLPDRGIEPASLASPVLVGGFFTTGATWEARVCHD